MNGRSILVIVIFYVFVIENINKVYASNARCLCEDLKFSCNEGDTCIRGFCSGRVNLCRVICKRLSDNTTYNRLTERNCNQGSKKIKILQSRPIRSNSLLAIKYILVHFIFTDKQVIKLFEVEKKLFDSILVEKQLNLSANLFSLSFDGKLVNTFLPIGKSTKISPNQIIIQVNNSIFFKKIATRTLFEYSLLFLSNSKSTFIQSNLSKLEGKSVSLFVKNLNTVDKIVLLGHPVKLGLHPLATNCKCKAFFGCTTQCCTNPTCNIILGICQKNDYCKKIDRVSYCACREDKPK